MSYSPRKIEAKWQKRWDKERAHVFDERSKKAKFYVLCMWPYVSAQGLHVGHPLSYTAVDIVARYQRMRGLNVLNPIGWDAFGLPTENYAIKTGTHPAKITKASIDTFRRQIKSLGLSYDWTRELNSSDPQYYGWTQWLFLFLYKKGLAYRAKAPVNWCPGCKTVLANEQVAAGECERCGSKVVQKELEQWFFKITDYAERLIKDLETVDWPEKIKTMQRNWIGRSEGAEIEFLITKSKERIKVFTTRPDTLFGATYVVLAPEHELVKKLESRITNYGEAHKYIKRTLEKTELERIAEGKEKTGIELKGITAINPGTKKEIPVWIADYVVARYGTGAIMAVPAHDARDFEFAKKFKLPIKKVVEGGEPPYEGEGKLVSSGKFNGVSSQEARAQITKFVSGKKKIQYRLRDWLISRQRYWGAPIPIVYCERCGIQPVPEKDLPVKLPTDVDFRPTGESPLARSKQFHKIKCPKCKESARREVDTMDTFVDSSWYFLRYLDPKNKKAPFDRQKAKKIMPVDVYVGGAEHAVLHLLYARFITKVFVEEKCLIEGEPFPKLRSQGLILGPDGQKMSKSRGNVINPDEVVGQFGADSFRMYEMFMGPLEDSKPWDTRGIVGMFRFLVRIWNFRDALKKLPKDKKIEESEELRRKVHRTIAKVDRDITNFSFNTAISALMILFSEIEKEKSVPAFRTFLLLLFPFAPHLTSEIWEQQEFGKDLWRESWPEVLEKYLREGEITLVIQVNGRVRDTITLPSGLSEKELVQAAKGSDNVVRYLEGKKLRNTIVVADRLVNFVVS